MTEFFVQRHHQSETVTSALEKVTKFPDRIHWSPAASQSPWRALLSPLYHPVTSCVPIIILPNSSLLQACPEVAKVLDRPWPIACMWDINISVICLRNPNCLKPPEHLGLLCKSNGSMLWYNMVWCINCKYCRDEFCNCFYAPLICEWMLWFSLMGWINHSVFYVISPSVHLYCHQHLRPEITDEHYPTVQLPDIHCMYTWSNAPNSPSAKLNTLLTLISEDTW